MYTHIIIDAIFCAHHFYFLPCYAFHFCHLVSLLSIKRLNFPHVPLPAYDIFSSFNVMMKDSAVALQTFHQYCFLIMMRWKLIKCYLFYYFLFRTLVLSASGLNFMKLLHLFQFMNHSYWFSVQNLPSSPYNIFSGINDAYT